MFKQFSKQVRKNRTVLALSATGLAPVLSVVTVTPAFADTQQTAEGFDLTKQATEAKFPVVFDRPSGVNAAALAGTLESLGRDSALYKSAVAAVPELADSGKMNSLLSDALSDNASNKAAARATIVKLINWYNGLGGEAIKTQSGQAYTADNLDEPINVLAVGFGRENNKAASDYIQSRFRGVSTTGDMMKALDSVRSGVSAGYKSAFDAYAAKVYAPGADISALSSYESVKSVLDAYENMYAQTASSLREKMIKDLAGEKEAAVAFFESAVITGRMDTSGGGTTDSNKPQEENVTTRWVDENGNPLSPDESGTDYKGQKTFDGYEFVESKTENGVRTYTYKKKETPKPEIVEDTVWVDENGKELKPKQSGQHPDNDGKSDIDGYELVSTKTTTDEGGNTHVVNTYRPVKAAPDTYWFDNEGNTLKETAKGQTLPDNDGVSDIPGYEVVSVYTITEADLAKGGRFENTNFKAGDVINIYKKKEEPKKPVTNWVDENGKPLKDPEEGQHPDNDGTSDIPGYEVVSVKTDEDGNVTNTYKKKEEPKKPTTSWVDENGKPLKDPEEGQHPDNDGTSDIPGYEVVSVKTDEDGNVVNTYKKKEEPKKPVTNWVDENGKPLKDPEEGQHPDNDGTSDIPGYELVETKTDEDGNVTNTYREIKKPVTNWVDENGKPLKDPEEGQHPDNDGKSDIPGYELVKTDTDKDGNVTNTYKKKPVTTWVDENGKPLKDPEEGQHPDNDGKSDIPGYELIESKVDKDGNVTNTYREIKKPVTNWVDENGKSLKDPEEGQHPDNDGKSDIPGYELVKTDTDKDGNVTNTYKKIAEPKKQVTTWVDENGNPLKDPQDGQHPDNDGESDIPGYVIDRVEIDPDGNVKNIYKKAEAPKPATSKPTAPAALPNTGDVAQGLVQAIGAGIATFGATGGAVAIKRNRRNKKEPK